MTKEEVLQARFGFSAFRPMQGEIIDSLLSGRDTLAVLPTGAGKSICFQVPALMLPGVTLVISPLVALMKDQVRALSQNGIPAAFLSADCSGQETAAVERSVKSGKLRLLYVSPERLRAPRFTAFVRTVPVSMLVVDEAHCVSQWGHDFRPSYLDVAPFLCSLPRRPVVCACTATATPRVREDICTSLKLLEPRCFVGSFDRENLYFEVVRSSNKLALLRTYLRGFSSRSGIVYCATRKTVDALYEQLSLEGFSVCRYHAGMTSDARNAAQELFFADTCRVMLCTNAFGMGIDKANVSFVIHYQMPGDLESYYQEAGRAGRDGKSADCVLLYDARDVSLQQFFIDTAAENAEGEAETIRQSKRLKEQRLSQMRRYAHAETCLRRELLGYFGEDAPAHCGNCSVCRARALPAAPVKKRNASAPDPELLVRLNALCQSIAAQKGIPAFAVFTRRTLERMAAVKPASVQAFGELEGVSAAKKEKYAAIFLKEIHKNQRNP